MDEIKGRRKKVEHDKVRAQAAKVFGDLNKKLDLDNLHLPPELAKAYEQDVPASAAPHLAAVNLVMSYGVGRSMMFRIGLETICETIDEIAKIKVDDPGACDSPGTNVLLRSISKLDGETWVTDNTTGAVPYLTQAYRFFAFGVFEVIRLFVQDLDIPEDADLTWPPFVECVAKAVAYSKSLAELTYNGLQGLGHGA